MSGDAINPIVPSIWDFALASIAVLAVVLFVVTLISIVRSKISPAMKLICALLVLAMPFIGCIVWFASKKSLERSLAKAQIN